MSKKNKSQRFQKQQQLPKPKKQRPVPANVQAYLDSMSAVAESKQEIEQAIDLVPSDWKVAETVASTQFKISDLEFVAFLSWEEAHVDGREMRKRAVARKANFGLTDGKYLLQHQAELPFNLRGKHIVLTGTLLCDTVGDSVIPYLHWNGDGWTLLFRWLGDDWRDNYRLVRLKAE